MSGGATQEKLKQFGGQTPLGRPGQPAELASIYVELASGGASYTNGQIYGAPGGAGQPENYFVAFFYYLKFLPPGKTLSE